MSQDDNLADTLYSKNKRLWSLKMSIDFDDIHATSVTASGVLVKIRSRMLFFRVGNGLTCSRKKSLTRSWNCTEFTETFWLEEVLEFQSNSRKLKSYSVNILCVWVTVLCVCVTKLIFCIKSPDGTGEGHCVSC